MQCDICFRTGGNKLPFLCPVDARNRLYETRVQHAHVLLENDSLEKQINNQLPTTGNEDKGAATHRSQVTALKAETSQAVDRTQQIIAYAEELEKKVKQARDEIAKRKAILSRRRSELSSATNGVEARRIRQTDEVDKATRMAKYKWNQTHSISASSRAFLCGEAAKLYGLRRVRKNGALEEYTIAGIGIVDLRSLNTSSPAQISTALSHIVHLLMLCTHYLAIRLPAEITLPHRDYPLPTIFPLASSYKYANVPFPGTTPAPSSSSSPTTSRQIPSEQTIQPRPRPLYIHKIPFHMATEDPAAYALFIEGVTLLAYNITWLCKSQGIPVGESTSFDDICNIGKNFYNLLVTSQGRPPTSRVPSGQTVSSKGGRDGDSESESKKSIMGRYTHGAAHSFLGNAEGTEFIRSWKLPSPTKLADQLRNLLHNEAANATWELVHEDQWTVDDDIGSDGVVVGARREESRGAMLGMQSFMSMKTVVDAVEMVTGELERKPGTSGWTKLKPR